MEPVNRKRPPPSNSCLQPLHLFCCLWETWQMSSLPLPSPSPGLAVWWWSSSLQPDRGWLAEPAEAEVQGGAWLLRRCPLCGRTGKVGTLVSSVSSDGVAETGGVFVFCIFGWVSENNQQLCFVVLQSPLKQCPGNWQEFLQSCDIYSGVSATCAVTRRFWKTLRS